mmetsp:Transcript_11826/g.25625  ORF Transcript_11826/g.25625 Transcript_11826/m.25625 type:complete len:222 (+) Transcript_11826:154-819(+)
MAKDKKTKMKVAFAPIDTAMVAASVSTNINSVRRMTLLPLLQAFLLAAFSYGTLLTYMYHNDAGLTDEYGYVSLKVSLDEKKMIEAHRKGLRLNNRNSERQFRRSRRLGDGALQPNSKSNVKGTGVTDQQQTKEEIQRVLARQLLEKGVSLRAARMKVVARYRGMADSGDVTNASDQDKKQRRHKSNRGSNGNNNVDPAWAKLKLELIQNRREQNHKDGSS